MKKFLSFSVLLTAIALASCSSDTPIIDLEETEENTGVKESEKETSEEDASKENGDDKEDSDSTSAKDTEAATKQNSGTGTSFEIGPVDGEYMAVVGVAFDDKLNFRSGPDPSDSIVNSLAPLDFDLALISQGEGLLFTNNAWWKVKVDGQDAYANFTYLGSLGVVQDQTTDIEAELGIENIQASPEKLVDAIAQVSADSDASKTIISEATALSPTSGTISFDLLGYKDDALKGERFKVEYAISTTTPKEYTLSAVEVTAICSRGTAQDKKCL